MQETAQRHREYRQSVATSVYKGLVRPILFKLDPEKAHALVTPLLRGRLPSAALAGYFDNSKKELHFTLGGKVALDGPIGLAAGFDKNASMLNGLANIFDYVTVGTALPYAWEGNPRRPNTQQVIRLPRQEAMLNSLGFPFEGLPNMIRNLQRHTPRVPINVNVSVRPSQGDDQLEAISQFAGMMRQLAVFMPSRIQMIEVNFASQNTERLSMLFEDPIFERVVGPVMSSKRMDMVLTFLKMQPHVDELTRRRNLNIAERWMALGGRGITIINGEETVHPGLSTGKGGKSGRPVYLTLKGNLMDYRSHLGNGPIINVAGGVTPDKVPELLIGLKADTVQMFTPFIYDGPGIVRDAKRMLAEALERHGYDNMRELVRENFWDARKNMRQNDAR